MMIVYCLLIFLIINIIPLEMFSTKYESLYFYVIIWALVVFFIILKNNFSFYLQAYLDFKILAIVGTITSVVTVIATVLMIVLTGKEGVLFGQLIGEIVFSVFLSYFISKIFKTST